MSDNFPLTYHYPDGLTPREAIEQALEITKIVGGDVVLAHGGKEITVTPDTKYEEASNALRRAQEKPEPAIYVYSEMMPNLKDNLDAALDFALGVAEKADGATVRFSHNYTEIDLTKGMSKEAALTAYTQATTPETPRQGRAV